MATNSNAQPGCSSTPASNQLKILASRNQAEVNNKMTAPEIILTAEESYRKHVEEVIREKFQKETQAIESEKKKQEQIRQIQEQEEQQLQQKAQLLKSRIQAAIDEEMRKLQDPGAGQKSEG